MASLNIKPRGASRALLWRLACLDVWRDKKISICMIAAVVSIVAPLMLLFGLKHGVVSQMRSELASQPDNLEVRMIASHALDRAWFDDARQQPFIGFVAPLTRSLNTTGDLRVSSRAFVADAELLPSLTGDPLLKGQAGPAGQSAWLSATAAQRLSLTTGETFGLMITRKRDGQIERLRVPLVVAGVLEAAVFARPAALITPALLTALEDFRDDKPWPLAGEFEPNPQAQERQRYPRARLYARTMDDVPALSQWLSNQDIQTVSRLAQIESVQAIDRLLQLLFGVIAWLGILGCAASLVGAFAANIDRKRKDLALLRLIGYDRKSLLGYVMVQALVLTAVGFVIGVGFYWVGSELFNVVLGQALPAGQYVSVLTPLHIASAVVIALGVAVVVSLIGGYMAMQVQPSESLRDA
jgi:putative ABC transport system permease protein